MGNGEDRTKIGLDQEIEIEHLNWEIPSKIKITSDREYYVNNGHGGQLYKVDKQKLRDFVSAEIGAVTVHIEYLRSILKLLD